MTGAVRGAAKRKTLNPLTIHRLYFLCMSVVSFAQDPALGFSIVDELLEPLGLEFRVWGLGFRLGAWNLGFGP